MKVPRPTLRFLFWVLLSGWEGKRNLHCSNDSQGLWKQVVIRTELEVLLDFAHMLNSETKTVMSLNKKKGNSASWAPRCQALNFHPNSWYYVYFTYKTTEAKKLWKLPTVIQAQKAEELGVKARGGKDIAMLSWAHRDFSNSQFGSSDVTELWSIQSVLPGPALNIQLHPPVLPSPSTESLRDVSSMAGLRGGKWWQTCLRPKGE